MRKDRSGVDAAAWQVCNAVSYPRMKEYAKNFLVVAPNLTVKERLKVLMPRKIAVTTTLSA